jgi:hypothetical protein
MRSSANYGALLSIHLNHSSVNSINTDQQMEAGKRIGDILKENLTISKE